MRIGKPVFHEGVADASGAVPVDETGAFFLVADDEDRDCVLRVYQTEKAGSPVQKFDLPNRGLLLRDGGEELDLEAAAWLDDRIFWIGSHSRDKNGKKQESRRRLFATTLTRNGTGLKMKLSGEPYCDLLRDLRDHLKGLKKPFNGFKLDRKRMPKEGGVSIEGLAGETSSAELYIGFRSPLVDGCALVVRLANPNGVLKGKKPKFAGVHLLNLGGLGIRSLEYCAGRKSFLVLGGSADTEQKFGLFGWKGGDSTPEPIPDVNFADMKLPEKCAPEGLFVYGEDCRVCLLFDEGKSEAGRFRTITVNDLFARRQSGV